MRRTILSLLAALLLRICGYSDSYASEYYPNDPQVIYGQLDNGIRYYVRKNSLPEKQASLRLAVKVGSMYEEEHEKGIAHFLEHMLFRGSDHFKDGEVIHYLESNGASFGADTNAYTGFDRTVYEFDIPIDKPNTLDQGLFILSEFACRATLAEDILNKERGVVLDELHTAEASAMSRFSRKLLNNCLSNTPLYDHLAIGKEEIVQTVPAEALRNFYKKWYRTDNMAIIAVGDFDTKDVTDLIISRFSSLPASQIPQADFLLTNHSATHPPVILEYDPEFTKTQIGYFHFEPRKQLKQLSDQDIKENILKTLSAQMLDLKLERLSKKDNAALFEPMAILNASLPMYDMLNISASCYEDNPLDGIKVLSCLLRELKRTGYSIVELNHAKNIVRKQLSLQLSNLSQIRHPNLAEVYVEHFVTDLPYLSLDVALSKSLEILDHLTLDEVNDSMRDMLFHHKKWTAVLLTPSKEIAQTLSQQVIAQASEIDDDQENLFAESNPDTQHSLPFIELKVNEGQIVKSSQDTELLVSYLELSNQAKALLKPTSFDKEVVFIDMFAPAGLTSFSQDHFFSAKVSSDYALESGLANLTSEEFNDLLKLKNIHLHVLIDNNQRKIQLIVPKQDLETGFQIVHALFTAQTYTQKAWNLQIRQIQEIVRSEANDPKIAFLRYVYDISTKGSVLFKPIQIDQLDSKKAESAMQTAFGRPADFTCACIGDFKEKDILPLIKKYIASIPSNNSGQLTPSSNTFAFPKGFQRLYFKKGHDNASKTIISYPFKLNSSPFDYAQLYTLDALKMILDNRLLNTLRHSSGGVYTVRCRILSPLNPSLEANLFQIIYTSRPDEAEKLRKLAVQEIARLTQHPISDHELSTIHELMRNKHKRNLMTNEHWVELIEISSYYGISLPKMIQTERLISLITIDKIQEMAKKIFNSLDSTHISWVPESFETPSAP